MEIRVQITSEILNLPETRGDDAGGVVRFTGLIRGEEDGRKIEGLEYEAYQPMAENQMRQILGKLGEEYPIYSAKVIHRIGFVPAGEAAIILEVRAAHRGEAFIVAEKFMNRLKQDVPIWKSGVR